MNLELIIHVLRHSILITGLVLIMMLMIEYFNIQSKGKWFAKIQGSRFKQIIIGAFLGAIPGCIGGFAAVSLFTHKLISLGALVAMMICSSGDEAFIILAMIPEHALLLFGLLFLLGIIVGCIVDLIYKKPQKDLCNNKFEIHTSCGAKVNFSPDNLKFAPTTECKCGCNHTAEDVENPIPSIFKLSSYKVMLHPSKERIALLLGIALFISAVIFGILECNHDHSHSTHTHNYSCTHVHTESCTADHNHNHETLADHNHKESCSAEHIHTGECTSGHIHTDVCSENHVHTYECPSGHIHTDVAHSGEALHGMNILNEKWINIVFAVISIITLFFTAAAKEHFIKEHLWGHVIKKHLVSIFLWTFGTLLVCQIGMQYLDVEHWISNNMYIVMLIAIAVGIIPESGPHIVFVTLFAQGVLPFYILLVNSMVQDGHTTLPLLAESKMSFAKAKLINICAGLVVGTLCWWLLG